MIFCPSVVGRSSVQAIANLMANGGRQTTVPHASTRQFPLIAEKYADANAMYFNRALTA